MKKLSIWKTLSTVIFIFALIAPACSLANHAAPQQSQEKPAIPEQTPETRPEQSHPAPAAPAQPTEISAGNLKDGPEANTYWVTNPSSGVDLFVRVFSPRTVNDDPLPTLVLVPGGIGITEENKAQRLADESFTVVIFHPDGRGRSQGNEDYDGFIHQDGLAAVIQAISALPEVDSSQIGLVTYSYGITMGSGVLARHPELPVKFLIDWEGPVDRDTTTTGCKPNSARIQWATCDDNEFWAQREALTFISQVRVPYQRLQSQTDHVQPNTTHAVNIVNAAVQGGVPWVRLNDYPAGQTYDLANLPAMFPDEQDRQLETLIARYARELFQ